MKYLCIFALLLVSTVSISADNENSDEVDDHYNERDVESPCHGQPNGYYVNNPARCRAFWLCQDGLETAINCPIGQNFNQDAQICDLPQNYPCIDGVDPVTTTTMLPTTKTTLQPETTTDETFDETRVCQNRPDGYFVNNPINCAAYWICTNKLPHDATCNVGQNFNEAIQVCDDPENFPCDENPSGNTDEPATDPPTTKTPLESTTKMTEQPPFECPHNGMETYPIPDTCTTYRLCFGGNYTTRRCADGLHFDEAQGLCDRADRVKCARGLCPAENDVNNIVTLPSDSSCHEFYVCFDGELQPLRCADGLMWNQDLGRCDHSYNVGCQHSDPDEESLNVHCPGDEVPRPHIIPHPHSCKEYFICSMDVPYLRVCPQDLLFDPVLQTCNMPEHVDCNI